MFLVTSIIFPVLSNSVKSRGKMTCGFANDLLVGATPFSLYWNTWFPLLIISP